MFKGWSVECSVNGWFKQPHLARVKLGEAAYLFEQPCLQVKPSPHTLRRSPPTVLCSETNWRYSKSLCSTDRALSNNENGSQYKKDMWVRYTQILHVRGRCHSLRRWLAGNRAPPSVVVTLSKTPHPHCIPTSAWSTPLSVCEYVHEWVNVSQHCKVLWIKVTVPIYRATPNTSCVLSSRSFLKYSMAQGLCK